MIVYDSFVVAYKILEDFYYYRCSKKYIRWKFFSKINALLLLYIRFYKIMQKKKKKFEFRYNLDSNRDVKDYKNLIKLIKDFLKYTVLRYMQVKKKKGGGEKIIHQIFAD